MSLINPKFRISVYSDVDFKEDPYDTTHKFNVFVPKPKNYIGELLSKHDDKVKAKEERHKKIFDERQQEKAKLHELKVSTYSRSPGNSPDQSPLKSAQRRYEEARESERQVAKKLIELEPTDEANPESKLKSKLKKDVELARTMDTDDLNKREIHFDETVKTTNLNNTQKESLLGDTMNDRTGPFDTRSAKSMNKSVRSGRSFKSKASGVSFRSHTSQKSELRTTLYFDTRTHAVPKTSLRNPVIENILDNEQFVMTNPTLFQSIVKLRDMNLLRTKSPQFNKFKGIGKINYVYNDFHSRSTNPGYSRNTGGNFYCR